MKKILTILALLFSTTCNCLVAQKPYHNETKANNGVTIGVKSGVNCPRLYYTNSNLVDLPHDFMMGLSAGVFVEIPFFNVLAFAPEINYQQRGGATSYIYEEHYNVSYRLEAEYVSIRVPIICYIPISNTIKPYLFLGPDAGYAVSGRISLTQPGLDIESSNTNINTSNYNYTYLGLLGGAGIRTNIPLPGFTLVIKADAAINFGLLDTFSESEHQETASPTNVHAYNHQGKRYLRGLEIHLGLGFIPDKEDDVCKQFNR